MASWAEYLVNGVPVDPTPEGYDNDNLFAKVAYPHLITTF
jgi:hypothetical protein